MVKLSKKLLFAVEAVLDIAYNASNQPVQSREVTRRQGIPKRYLEQILQQLVRAGILTGVRGPRGGYLLARERRRITVGEIARIVENSGDNGEADHDPGSSELGRKVVRPMWIEMEEKLMKGLDKITIEELCMRANVVKIENETDRRLDFTI
jgi:Rrf2 family protein